MAKSGDILEHPITGERIVIRKSAQETGGALFQGDLFVAPKGFVAAEHIHLKQEECFEVISGTLRARVKGREVAYGPGESLVVAAGTPHVWWNSGDTEMHVLVEFRPALRTEHFFEAFFGIAQEGKVSPKTGLPNPLQMAVLMRAYRDELILARPPQPVQTLLFGLLAPIGRLFGYRAERPYPHQQPAQVKTQPT